MQSLILYVANLRRSTLPLRFDDLSTCTACSSKKALIHPDNIVLRGFSTSGSVAQSASNARALKVVSSRDPQRVCDKCFDVLRPQQASLRLRFSNSMRFNSVDSQSNWFIRTFGNSPLAFTLGHEVRKAAVTLSNLLPLPKRTPRGGASVPVPDLIADQEDGPFMDLPSPPASGLAGAAQIIKGGCINGSSNLREIDGVRIPGRLLEKAKGIAIITVAKGGVWFGGEFGSGLVIARLPGGGWSAPSAIGLVGFSVGPLIGAQISDHVFLLMNDKAVDMLGTKTGSVNLGVDLGVAVGPVGRNVEVDFGVTDGGEGSQPAAAPIYTYSLTKGLYAGASLDGKMMATRHDVNEKFYGMGVSCWRGADYRDNEEIKSGRGERGRRDVKTDTTTPHHTHTHTPHPGRPLRFAKRRCSASPRCSTSLRKPQALLSLLQVRVGHRTRGERLGRGGAPGG